MLELVWGKVDGNWWDFVKLFLLCVDLSDCLFDDLIVDWYD